MKYAKPVGIPSNPGLLPIQLYPDPTDGVLFVTGLTDMHCAFRILDVAGRVVLEGTMHMGAVDTGPLRTGIYFLHSVANGRELRLPFVRE